MCVRIGGAIEMSVCFNYYYSESRESRENLNIIQTSSHFVSNGYAITMQKSNKFRQFYLRRGWTVNTVFVRVVNIHPNCRHSHLYGPGNARVCGCSAHFFHYYFFAIDCISIFIITIYWNRNGTYKSFKLSRHSQRIFKWTSQFND